MISLPLTTWLHLGRGVTRIAILTIPCLAVLLSLSACGFPAWRDNLMKDLVEGRWHANPSQIPAGG
jgi:hypothetical protein